MHWAYDHKDPNEKRGVSGKDPDYQRELPYSWDIDHYVAMCVPCHKVLDLSML